MGQQRLYNALHRLYELVTMRILFRDEPMRKAVDEAAEALKERREPMEINFNIKADIHYHGDGNEIRCQLEKIMKTIDEVLDAVTAESTKVDGIITLIASLKQQIADALSGATLPPAVQAKVDAVFAGLQANAAKIDTALEANVPTP